MMRSRLKKMNKEYQKNRREYYLFNDIPILIKDQIDISIQDVVQKIEQIVEKRFFKNIDEILIGQFDFLDLKQINAAYADGAIYVSNVQDSIEDLVDDIVHEVAHSIEQSSGRELYGDGDLEKEFLVKRAELYRMLKNQPFRQKIEVPEMKEFINSEYNQEFDLYLLQTIGYDNLSQLPQIFPTPYSITSLSEYFAIGFEEIYLKNKKNKLNSMCPILFKKLFKIIGDQ